MCDKIILHLTTAIAEIDIYILESATHRGKIKDLQGFKLITSNLSNAVKTASTAKTSKNKHKAGKKQAEYYISMEATEGHEENEGGKGKGRPRSGNLDKQRISEAMQFLKDVDLDLATFKAEFIANFSLFEKETLTRGDRLHKSLSQRLFSLSGLGWNPKSQNRFRDWSNLVTVVVLETALVEKYRENLVTQCPSASFLRKMFHDFLLGYTAEQSAGRDDSGKKLNKNVWEYPDNIPVPKDAPGPKWVAEDIANRYEVASVPELDRFKTDDIRPLILAIEKSKYVDSADPDDPPEAMETIVYHCLRTIAKACRIFRWFCPHLSCLCSQVMYRNKVRLEHGHAVLATHKSSADEEDVLGLSLVEVPYVIHRPHCKSEEYHKEVPSLLSTHHFPSLLY